MGSEERELEDLLRIKRRRLNALEKQVARLGYSASAELVNERDDLRAELDKSQKAIEPIVKGELPDDIMAALRAYGIPASVNNALQLVESRLYDLKRIFEEYRQELHAVKDQVMPLRADVQALKVDNEEGKRGRKRNFQLFIVAIVLLIVIAAVVIPTAARVFGGR